MRRLDNAIHNIKHQGLIKGLKNLFFFNRAKNAQKKKNKSKNKGVAK